MLAEKRMLSKQYK